MVRLTVDIIARCTSGYAKKKRDESIQHYLKRLTHLYLENRSIDQIGDDLGLCRALTVLYLYDNKLTKIPNLNGNCNLTHLYLQNNQITKLDGLNVLQKLSKLYIGGNSITVVEGLEKLQQLEELHVENQKIPIGEKLLFDPRTLVSLRHSLQVLNVSGNHIDSVRDLQCLTLMTQFMASDNTLSDIKELAHVLGSWNRLWRLELNGNPLCHKAKYRDRIIIMTATLELLDGKEVTETAKKFLKNWQTNRENVKRRQESLSRQTSLGSQHTSHHESRSSIHHTQSAANRLGSDVPGYIMPAMPRKQFQDVLAKSASQPNSALDGRTPLSKNFSDLNNGPRYLNSYGTLYHDSPRSRPPTHDPTTHKLSTVQLGAGFAGDGPHSQIGTAAT